MIGMFAFLLDAKHVHVLFRGGRQKRRSVGGGSRIGDSRAQVVIPAKAGIHFNSIIPSAIGLSRKDVDTGNSHKTLWIPTFAGMTDLRFMQQSGSLRKWAGAVPIRPEDPSRIGDPLGIYRSPVKALAKVVLMRRSTSEEV